MIDYRFDRHKLPQRRGSFWGKLRRYHALSQRVIIEYMEGAIHDIELPQPSIDLYSTLEEQYTPKLHANPFERQHLLFVQRCFFQKGKLCDGTAEIPIAQPKQLKGLEKILFSRVGFLYDGYTAMPLVAQSEYGVWRLSELVHA